MMHIRQHCLELVLWGIKKEQAVTCQVWVWLPITAFFGFFRIGEMMVPNQESFDDALHLSLRDISVDSRSNPTTIWLTIKQSKTDPFHSGVKLCLTHAESRVCPVKTLLPYLAVRGSSPGPLFTFSDHTYLARSRFKTVLSATLEQAGLDDSKYNTHSFCIGAVTSAKAAGISDMHIQILGRWQSSAYQSYIRTPTPVLKKLSKQLVLSLQSVSA